MQFHEVGIGFVCVNMNMIRWVGRHGAAASGHQLGDGVEPGVAVLFVDGLEGGAVGGGLDHEGTHLVGHVLDLGLLVAGVLLEGAGPGASAEGLAGKEDRGGRDLGVGVPHHVVLGERDLDSIHAEHVEALLGGDTDAGRVPAGAGLDEAGQEVVGGRGGDLELQPVEDRLLHGEDLVLGVGAVADEDEVADLGGPDLLVLGGDEHGGDPDELEVLPGDPVHVKVPVDDLDRQEEGLGHQTELEVHLHEPVDQDGAHLVVDVGLLVHVVLGGEEVLDGPVVGVDVLDVLCLAQVVVLVLGVDVWERGAHGAEHRGNRGLGVHGNGPSRPRAPPGAGGGVAPGLKDGARAGSRRARGPWCACPLGLQVLGPCHDMAGVGVTGAQGPRDSRDVPLCCCSGAQRPWGHVRDDRLCQGSSLRRHSTQADAVKATVNSSKRESTGSTSTHKSLFWGLGRKSFRIREEVSSAAARSRQWWS